MSFPPYKATKSSAQYEHEEACETTTYSSQEIQTAGRVLSEDVRHGHLKSTQTTFERDPLEAVPNVCEGDEKMMEHVLDFPPTCVALPEQLTPEAGGSIPQVGRKRPIPRPAICDDSESSFWGIPSLKLELKPDAAQYEHEEACETITYSSQEIQTAGRVLSEDVRHGHLKSTQTTFERDPLEAVPNVCEGDEKMMEHVLDFPPTCVALPEQLTPEAGGSIPQVGRKRPIPRPAICDDSESSFWGIPSLKLELKPDAAQYEHEEACETITYSSQEIQTAGRVLSEDVRHGHLKSTQTTFERDPLEAVPNVCEGDEKMMEHVLDFPPTCVALPEQLTPEAGGSIPQVGRKRPIPRPSICDDSESSFWGIPSLKLELKPDAAQYEHEEACETTTYSSQEIQTAGRVLSEDVRHGHLKSTQTTFERDPLEAVPNVCEGDERMMEHVLDFKPTCVALPEQLTPEAGGSIPQVGRKRPIPRPAICDDSESGFWGIPPQKLELKPDAAQYEHEEACETITYSSQEIQTAGRVLSEDVRHGHLKSTQTTFERDPLEAVPNVCDGDERMMEHVLDFPPTCVALPEQLTPEAGGSIPQVGRKKPIPRPAICDGGESSFWRIPSQKRELKPKVWMKLAKVYVNLVSIQSALLGKVTAEFEGGADRVRRNACFDFKDLYIHMKKMKASIDNAEVICAESNFSDLFQQMSQLEKLEFKKKHAIHGEIPDSMASVVQKYKKVRDQMGEFVLRNWDNLSSFKTVTREIMKNFRTKSVVFSGTDFLCVGADEIDEPLISGNSAQSDIPDYGEELDGGGNSEKRKSGNVGDTEASNVSYNEELFWENVMLLKTLAQKAATALSQVNDTTIPSTSNRSVKKTDSDVCRLMLLARKNKVIISKTLVKLKEEMNATNYEDRKPFSTDDLVRQGIGLTPDNSLGVIEAMLNQLQEEYLRVQREQIAVLNKFGYGWKVGIKKRAGQNIRLVRICAHSKCQLKTPGFYRVMTQTSEILHNQNEPGQDSQQNPDTGGDHDSPNPAVEELDDGGADVGISKTANSMSFFMSNLEPGALAVTEPSCTPATEEFIEQEKQYWDRLQKMLLKINKLFDQVAKERQSYSGRFQTRNSMNVLRQRMKELLQMYECERAQACQAGYCMYVTYQNQGYLPESYEDILVKSLDQIKDRIDAAYRNYIQAAKKLGIPFSYQL